MPSALRAQLEPHKVCVGHATGVPYELASPLPGIAAGGLEGVAPVRLEVTGRDAIEAAWSGADGPPLWQTVFSDGAAYRIERGVAGDHLLVYSDRAVFHVDRDVELLRCAPAEVDDHRWKRVLLDDVFYALSALRGFALLHCSAVASERGVVAICAATGGGKTTLALELMSRGHPLVCDDLLAIDSRDGVPIAYPGPAVMSVSRAAYMQSRAPAGRVLGPLPGDDELWLEVERAATSPDRLAAIFVLSRLPETAVSVARRATSVVDLLPYAIGLALAPGSQNEKFQTLSDVAEKVAIHDLTIPADLPAADAAALVEAAVATTGFPERGIDP